MPIWDFYCDVCQYTEELHFKNYDASKRAKCHKCKSKLTRMPSAASAKFVGPGFYTVDYAKKSATDK